MSLDSHQRQTQLSQVRISGPSDRPVNGPVAAQQSAGRCWWWQLAAVAALTAIADLCAKALLGKIGSCCGGAVVGSFGNRELAFGIAGGHHIGLVTASLSALVLLVLWSARHPTTISGWPVGLIVGGGGANAIDRVVDGVVVDYLVIADAYVINLADIAVSLGLAAGTALVLHHQWVRVMRSK